MRSKFGRLRAILKTRWASRFYHWPYSEARPRGISSICWSILREIAVLYLFSIMIRLAGKVTAPFMSWWRIVFDFIVLGILFEALIQAILVLVLIRVLWKKVKSAQRSLKRK